MMCCGGYSHVLASDVAGREPIPIAITDDRLQVLADHQLVYGCHTVDLPEWGIQQEECFIRANGAKIYKQFLPDPPLLAPGYRFNTQKRLEVDRASYGKGTLP